MKYILSESFRNPFGIVNISFYQGKKFIESRPQGFIKLMNSSYLGYTLTCGHSWKNSINPNPKTIKSLIKNLQNSFAEIESACFQKTHVHLKEE